MNLDNISEADLDRLLEALHGWATDVDPFALGLPIAGYKRGYRTDGRQIIREWLESLGDKV